MEDYYRKLLKKYIANSMQPYFAHQFVLSSTQLFVLEYDDQEIDEIKIIIEELEREFDNRA